MGLPPRSWDPLYKTGVMVRAFQCLSSAWIGYCAEFSGDISAILVVFEKKNCIVEFGEFFYVGEDGGNQFQEPQFFGGLGFPHLGFLTSDGLRSPKAPTSECLVPVGVIGLKSTFSYSAQDTRIPEIWDT